MKSICFCVRDTWKRLKPLFFIYDMTYLNSNILNDIPNLKNKFSSAKPFKHLFIENFLDEKTAEVLLKELKNQEFEEKEADLFHFHQTNDFINLREGKLKDFYEYFKGKEVKKLIEEITGIKLKAKIDMAGSLYKDTNFLLCHDDELSGRKIAFLIYLPKNFEEKDIFLIFYIY